MTKAESWQKLEEGLALTDFCEAGGEKNVCRRRMECARYLYLSLRPAGHGRVYGRMCPDLSRNPNDPKLFWMPVEEHSRNTLMELTAEEPKAEAKPLSMTMVLPKPKATEPRNKLPSDLASEIIRLKQEGMSNRKLAAHLGIGVTTVKRYWGAFNKAAK